MALKTNSKKLRKSASESVHFILVRPRNPLNIGAAARAVANFGFSSIRVVDPFEPVWKETKSAVGAEPLIENARKFENLEDAISDCRTVIGTTALKNRTPAHPIASAGKPWLLKKLRGPWGILFGSEKSGLKNEDLLFCHALLHIPTDKNCPSMNLSQSVAVASFWVRHISGWMKKEGRLPAAAGPASLTSEEAERLVQAALDAVKSADVFPQWSEAVSRKKLREAFRRMNPAQPDAAILHGIFRRLKMLKRER